MCTPNFIYNFFVNFYKRLNYYIFSIKRKKKKGILNKIFKDKISKLFSLCLSFIFFFISSKFNTIVSFSLFFQIAYEEQIYL